MVAIGVALLVLACAGGVRAAEYWVDPLLGSDSGPGSEGLPWRTLAHALASVQAGDTVHAVAGSYGVSSPLALVDGVALVGAGAGSTSVTGPFGHPTFEMGDQPLGPDTRLEGFTFHGGSSVYDAVILVRLGAAVIAPTIVGNVFDAYGGTAILVQSQAAAGGAFSARIAENTLCGFADFDIELHAGGPHVIAPVIENNIFECGDAGSLVFAAVGDWSGTISPEVRGNRFAGAVVFSAGYLPVERSIDLRPVLDSNQGFFRFDLYPHEPEAGGSLVGDITVTGDASGHSNVLVLCSSPNGPAIGKSPAGTVTLDHAADWPHPVSTRTGRPALDDRGSVAPGGAASQRAAAPSSLRFSARGADLSLWIDLASSTDRWVGGVDVELVDNQVDQVAIDLGDATVPIHRTVLMAENRITPRLASGVIATIGGAGSGSFRMEGNSIQASGPEAMGVVLHSDDWGGDVSLECNEISSAWRDAVHLEHAAASVDLGGGTLTGGLNSLEGHPYGLSISAPDPVSAQHNWWGTSDASEVASRIFGPAVYEPFLTAPPGIDVTASLVAAVVDDTAPPGPSIGDTLEYTAEITVPDAACGDRALRFEITTPDNVTLVPGSVTSDIGEVLSEQPIAVAIDWLGKGGTAVVRWQVVVDSGTQVVSQGTVGSERVADRPTDDPSQPGDSDPTVVELVVARAVPIGPAAAVALGAAIAAAGAALLRRRRQLDRKSIT